MSRRGVTGGWLHPLILLGHTGTPIPAGKCCLLEVVAFCGILGESVQVSKTAGPFEGSICSSLALGPRPPTKSNLGLQRPLHGVGEDKCASLSL